MATFSNFDIIKSVAIDPMHCIYSGVTKALISLWFDSSHHGKPWYCKSYLLEVNNRLQNISPTYETTKAVRSINDRKFWKGTTYIIVSL